MARMPKSAKDSAARRQAELAAEREDYLIALARLQGKGPTVPIEELERRLGLED